MMLNISGCGESINTQTDDVAVETQIAQIEKRTDETTPNMDNADSQLSDVMMVHFIDVGQADSIFIELANKDTMLIDAGRGSDGGKVVNYIQNLNHKDIDYVIATHPHDDHIGGMEIVLRSFDVGRMYMPKQAHTTRAFENMLNAIEDENIELYTAKAGINILTCGNIKIDILAPISEIHSNLNNCSAIVRIIYGQTVMLFTGDAEREIENQLLNEDIDADVLKVGHHGAGTSSSASFIQSVTPEVAVISCGAGNSYGHPHEETIVTLNQVGANVYRTDEEGTIVITADANKKITVDKKASSIKENAPPTMVNSETKIENESIADTNNISGEIVYRTRIGTKFHKENCSYLKSKIEVTVSEAIAMGLEPCSRCQPDR